MKNARTSLPADARLPGLIGYGQKKTCASAQAGVIKVVNVKSTPPINTSGIARISMQ
ncbi:hypothetical protein [Raoultella terrigena]|uniref:hypothetical protein n=1 Tax=Raoultella terrigena TaxID=577 RepID=UPI003A4C5689